MPSQFPSIYMKQTTFNKYLVDRCTVLRAPYQSIPLLQNAHVETIFAALFRHKPDVHYRREYLTTPNKGTLALDWEEGFSVKSKPEDTPIVVLVPGLTGHSGDAYIRHAAVDAAKAGYRPVVFNHKGGENLPVTIPQLYSASYTEDIRFAISTIQQQYPQAPMLAAGWSLGANVLLRYLGEEGTSSPITAAASLCNPFDLTRCMQRIETGFSRIYDLRLAANLKSFIQAHQHMFKDAPRIDLPRAMKATTIREFDIALTAPTFGWRSVEEYYEKSSSSLSVPQITTPLLCVQAANDPMAPIEATPIALLGDKDKCLLVVTPQGGHLGWMTQGSKLTGGPWSDKLLTQYFGAILAAQEEGVGADAQELVTQ